MSLNYKGTQPFFAPGDQGAGLLEVRVELVCDRQPRAERERAPEGFLGTRLAVERRLDVLADETMASTEPVSMPPRSDGLSDGINPAGACDVLHPRCPGVPSLKIPPRSCV